MSRFEYRVQRAGNVGRGDEFTAFRIFGGVSKGVAPGQQQSVANGQKKRQEDFGQRADLALSNAIFSAVKHTGGVFLDVSMLVALCQPGLPITLDDA